MYILFNPTNKQLDFMVAGEEYSIPSNGELKIYRPEIANVAGKSNQRLGIVVFNTDKAVDRDQDKQLIKIKKGLSNYRNFLFATYNREASAKRFVEINKGTPQDFLNLKIEKFKQAYDEFVEYEKEFLADWTGIEAKIEEAKIEEMKPFIVKKRGRPAKAA